MDPLPQGVGWMEVVTGCMFSGKTSELIRRVQRAMYARQSVVVFKPRIDDRYTDDSVGSHSGQTLRSIQIDHAGQIPGLVSDAQVVAVDEAHFLGLELVAIVENLANEGRRVIVAGLDMDYRGVPFEPIPQLLAVSEYITKNLAICMVCGNPADRSQRMVDRSGRFLVGAAEAYEARCRKHWSAEVASDLQRALPLGRNLAEELPVDLPDGR